MDKLNGQDQMQLIERAKKNMELATFAYKDHSNNYSEAERDYRIALAKKIIELKAEGYAATLILDLCKGDKVVANLKMTRDIESGLMQSAQSAIYNYRLEFKVLTEQAKQDMFG